MSDTDQRQELSIRAAIAELNVAMVERMKGVEVKTDLLYNEVRDFRSESHRRWADVEGRLRTVEAQTDDLQEYKEDIRKMQAKVNWIAGGLALLATAAPFVVQYIERLVLASP
jgi:hypothetical protein